MAQLPSSAVELGRLFSLMEGVDPENLFTALRAAGGGGDLSQASLSLPPGFSLPANFSLPPGLEGLSLPLGPMPADDPGPPPAPAAGISAGMEGGGSTDEEEDDRGSVGGTQATGGVHNPPPRTGSINDRKCTKVLPASSSAPKYKFVVPNEYVYKFMKHLVERPFHMRDMGGKLWDCVLIQRKNKEKYEYMIQGWRRFGESTGVQEGDTVTIEMVSDTVLQLTLERTGGTSGKKRARPSSGPPLPPGMGAADRLPHQQDVQQPQLEQQDGGQGGMSRPGGLPLGGMQPPASGGQYGEAGAPSGPQQLLDLIQQHQQQHAAQHAAQAAQLAGLHAAQQRGGTPAPDITPRSLTQHLANGLGAAGGLAQGGFTDQHIAELTSFVSQLDKRQRVGEGPAAPGSAGASGAGAAPPGTAGAIRMLSDVADVEGLVQQNNMVREQLRLAEAKIATLETGVLNIKSVLTRNTDPGLIAMTGVINLLNQMEAQDFLPELTTIGRMTLTGLCSEIRRHLNGVLRMVWILRSLPDDVQQHNSSGGGGMGGTAPGANSGPG
ncbi:hypothetical protein ABPG75_007791 [Micractinium tetrahymenae]